MAITFRVGFQVSDKELRNSLNGIQKDIENAFNIKTGMTSEIQKATQQAMILEKAMKRATTDKGISFYSLTSELNKAGTSASKLTATLTAGGAQFAASLNAANTALATADRSVISLNRKVAEMARVLTQSFKFTAAQTFLQSVSNAAQEAYQWVYDLNKTVTDISVVTGYTGDQLDKVTKNAIAGAKELRIAANDYAEGALIFYQQGLGDDEVARRVEITAQAARAAGTSLEEMSSQLTAIWNTYKMTGDEMQRAASVGAKMAGDTAVDFADIAEAMQTAAAPAEQMGVSYNSLAAIIATVGDTTQQSASVIGNAFKTIFSRFQQLKSEGTDGEVTLNRVSSQLQELGVNVLDSAGNLRSLDTVIAEVGDQWDGWSSKQQLAIAQLVGGTRQYGQFLTLMNNFDKYQDLLNSANLEDGSTLTQQYEASLDSIESRAENAAESMRRAFSNLIDVDLIKSGYGVIEDLGNVLETVLETMGGIKGVGIIIAGIFSKQIVSGISNAASKLKTFATNLTPKQREKSINRQYQAMGEETDRQIARAQANGDTEGVLNATGQKAKTNFDKDVALINDRLTTSLKSATGEYKIQLQYQQSLLKSSQELNQSAVDRLTALEKQALKTQDLSAAEQQRAQNEVDQARDEQTEALTNLQDLETKWNKGSDGQGAIKYRPNDDQEKIKLAAELAAARERATEATKKLQEAENKLNTKNSAFNKGMSDLIGSAAGFEKMGKSAEGLDDLKQQMLSVVEVSGKTGPEIDTLREQINNLGADGQEISAEGINALIASISNLGKISSETEDSLGELIDAGGDMDTAEKRKETASTPPPVEELPEPKRDLGEAATSGINGLMQLASAATLATSAVSTLFATWSDPDASGLEKVIALIGTLGAIIPTIQMGVDGFNAIKSAVINLSPALQQAIAQQAAMAASSTTAAAAAGAVGPAAAASGAQAAAGGAAGAAAGTSMAAAWAAALWPIVAIAAAIGAVVAVVGFFVSEASNKSPEKQLEKTKEAAEGLATAAEEAQTAADNLRTTIEGYNDAVDTLNDCVVGTDEWKEALEAANDAALELVNNLPDNADLEGLYSRNSETDLIEFDQDKLAEIQEQANLSANRAQYAAQVGEISVQQATNNVQRESVEDSLFSKTNLTDSQITDLIDNHIQELGDALSADEFKQKLEDLGATFYGTDEQLQELYTQCQNLASGMQNATDKAELFAQMQVDEILGDDYSAAEKQIAGEQLTQSTEDWEQKYLGALTNGAFGSSEMANEWGDIYKSQDQINKDLLAEYNRLTGKNWASSGNGVQGTDTNRIFEFINEEGEIVQLRAEQVAAEMAAAKALEEVTGSAEKASQALANLDSDYSEDFSNFITSGNFNSMTEGEVSENFEVGDDGKVTTESAKEYLLNAFGSEENLQAYADSVGKTVDEVVQEVVDGANVTITAMDNISENLSRTPKKIYDGLIDEGTLENASVESQQAVANMIQNAFTANGEAGAQALSDFIDTATEGLEPEEVDDFISTLGGIDWENVTPEGLREQLENAGFAMDDFTNGSLSELIAKMQEASGLTFDSASENYNKYNDIGKELNYGSQISDEDYQTLTDGGTNGMAQFFTQTQEGIWVLTGDATKFHEELRNQSTMTFEQLKQQQNEQKAIYDGIMNDINSGAITEEDLTESVIGKTNGQEIKDAQLAYLTANKDTLSEDQQTQLMEWTADDATFSADDYAAIAEMAKEAGISIDGMRAAQEQLNEEMNQVDEAEKMQELMDTLTENDIDPEEVFEMADGLQKMAEASEGAALGSEGLSEDLIDNADAAAEVAKEIKRYDKAVESVADNYEDWSDALESGNLEDQTKAINEMEEAYGNMLDIDGSQLSQDFLTNAENLELMKAAAEGDVAAMQQLAEAAQNDILLHAEFAPEEGTNLYNQVMAMTSQIQDSIQDVEVGAELNDAGFLSELTNLVNMAGLTAEEATAYLSSMGIDAEIEEDKTKSQDEVVKQNIVPQLKQTGTMSVPVVAADGSITYNEVPIEGVVYDTEPTDITETRENTNFALKVTGATRNGNTFSSGGNFKHNNSTSGSGNSSPKKTGGGGGGGGGSAPKHSAIKAKKYEPMAKDDRYSTIKASIEEVQRSIDRLDETESDMYGGIRLKAIEQKTRQLHKQAESYKDLYKEAQKYLDIDQADAQKQSDDVSKELGVDLIDPTFNTTGFVSNRTEIIKQLDELLEQKYNLYKAEADAYDADQSTDETRKENIDKLKEDYEDTKELVDEYVESLSQVDDTAQEAEDALKELVEMIRTEIANQVELITYEIELKIDISDRNIEYLEHVIDRLGDMGLQTGAAFQNMFDVLNNNKATFDNALQGFNDLAAYLEDLRSPEGQAKFISTYGPEAWADYVNQGILPEELYSAMEDEYSTMFDAMESYYDMVDQMFEGYLDLLDIYQDRFDQIVDKLDTQMDRLDLYQELLEFSGQQYTDEGREAMTEIYDTRLDTISTNMAAAQGRMDMLSGEVKTWNDSLMDFLNTYGEDPTQWDTATTSMYNNIMTNKEEVEAAFKEAEDDFYSNMQEFASTAAEAIEYGAERIRQEIVNSLGGLFSDFSSMTEIYDQKETLRTFFLEDYDQTYQLESLLREIDEAMEDVTDPERMNEYKALMEEINKITEDGTKLTQTDVDLLKAKFEIQKAQDAYEEQKNMKTTMRLARDASGNWNYVYSSDAEQSEDAVQALADAQYNYDKLLHEARDESSQMWLQIQQEFFEFQAEIDYARLEHDEQYRQEIQEQWQYYVDLTGLYSDKIIQYNDMLGENFADTTLGIVTNYDDMGKAQSDYTLKHEEYHEQLKENTQKYGDKVNAVCDQAGMDYNNLAQQVKIECQKIRSENSLTLVSIQNLASQGATALGRLSGTITSSVNQWISDLQRFEAEIQKALQMLNGLTEESLQDYNNGGFDAQTYYTAVIQNYLYDNLVGPGSANGIWSEEEKREWITQGGGAEYLAKLEQELYNKMSSDALKALGHSTLNSQSWEQIQANIDKMVEAAIAGKLTGGVDEFDESEASKIYNDRYGNSSSLFTASGGLIKTPQIRSLAEEGPELVLNNQDTQNILDAVKNMREVVKMKMSNINTSIGKQTDGVSEKTVINKDIQQVDQTVSIDATFPNVSVAAEIEEALNNLINQAVQYATRNNR